MKVVKPIEILETLANLRRKLDDFFGPTEPGTDAESSKVNAVLCEAHFQRAMKQRSMAKANELAAVKTDPVDDLVVL